MKEPQLTAARLRELLQYDPDTGIFTWRVTNSKRAPAGSVAGCINGSGYVVIRVDGALYRAHRLAWLHVHGEWPPDRLDHEDLNRANNRISNLRPATRSQNGANTRCRVDNAWGVKGVYWHGQAGKWRAKIRVNGLTTHLGLFDAIQDASAAYAKAARETFGEFARAA